MSEKDSLCTFISGYKIKSQRDADISLLFTTKSTVNTKFRERAKQCKPQLREVFYVLFFDDFIKTNK